MSLVVTKESDQGKYKILFLYFIHQMKSENNELKEPLVLQ